MVDGVTSMLSMPRYLTSCRRSFHSTKVNKSWHVVRRSLQHKRSVLSKMNHRGTPARPTYYSVSAPSVSGAPCTMEEMSKPQGTGTYFPNTNHYRIRNLTGRGRTHVAVRSSRSNGRLNTSAETDFVERSSELLQPHFLSLTSYLHSSGSPRSTNSDANRSPQLSENALEFSPSGQSFWATLNNVVNDWMTRNSIILSPPVKDLNQDRGPVHSYRLKDEGDFPPLSLSTHGRSSIHTPSSHCPGSKFLTLLPYPSFDLS